VCGSLSEGAPQAWQNRASTFTRGIVHALQMAELAEMGSAAGRFGWGGCDCAVWWA
jgi:hypothetical protein